MALSTDNQDYGKADAQNKGNEKFDSNNQDELSSDDLKGKKVDADPAEKEGQPAKEE